MKQVDFKDLFSIVKANNQFMVIDDRTGSTICICLNYDNAAQVCGSLNELAIKRWYNK